jgi:hypothetical protein
MKRFGMGLLLILVAGVALADNDNRRLLGDQLRLPEQVSRSADLPQRGASSTQVQSRWGDPRQREAAVGDPPISRWIYAGFTVYFEHSHVIHSVATADGE